MKGLVLSGGKGTRLRPITFTSAKQLLPIANKPVLFYCLEQLAEAGVTDVGIVVGETKAEIREAVGDGSRFGIKTTYIEQDTPAGLAHAVLVAESFIKDEPFIMVLGDNLLRDGVTSIVAEYRSRPPNCQILLTKVKNPNQFGVAELRDGEIHEYTIAPQDFGLPGKPLPASRLAILPATSHTAIITQTDLLMGFIEPFLNSETACPRLTTANTHKKRNISMPMA